MSIDFSDIDNIVDSNGVKEDVIVPKDKESLEKKNERINNESNEDKLDIGKELEISLDSLSFDNELTLDNDINLDIQEL